MPGFQANFPVNVIGMKVTVRRLLKVHLNSLIATNFEPPVTKMPFLVFGGSSAVVLKMGNTSCHGNKIPMNYIDAEVV